MGKSEKPMSGLSIPEHLQAKSDLSSILPSPSGTCLICGEEIFRRSLIPHLLQCMERSGRKRFDTPSFLLHLSPLFDSRYYLIILARPEATCYDLDHLLKLTMGIEGDRSSRFQVKGQYFFSHMNDGYPGMNVQIQETPLIRDSFLYLLYSHGWYPEILSGSLMGTLPFAPKSDRVVELIAINREPEEYHIWPQRPKRAIG